MRFWKQTVEESSGQKASQGNAVEESGGRVGDVETAIESRPISHHEKQPTLRFTAHQAFYIFGLDGVGAAILSGGINFGIAYGMYSFQNLATHPIRLFQLPNTLAGDAVVTILIQTMITWFIELILVEHDLKNGAIRPIGFYREPVRPLWRWLMLLAPIEDGGQVVPARSKKWPAFLVDQFIRIGLIFVVSFFLLWGPSVGILVAIGKRGTGSDWDWYFQKQWAPQIFKGVLGGLLALLTTPVMAFFWLVREGWRLRRGEPIME
ncbi:hypothetical protein K4K55_003793 [Colletotrichum sp. SAR 10_96]|nr:hypothetical protein K4K55_003793 [Colletotrichum sp. SAR 10_96]